MPSLLIVEDQKRLLGSLRRGLEEEGYEVVTTPTGEEGYYLATTQPFDALVLDLVLPGGDGLRAHRQQSCERPPSGPWSKGPGLTL